MNTKVRRGAIIKVIGVGGGGNNAVNRMVDDGLQGVEFYVANTDLQSLEISNVKQKIELGPSITGGLQFLKLERNLQLRVKMRFANT